VRHEWIKGYSLKLDAAWQPLEIIGSYRAFNMCYSGRAKMVSGYMADGIKIPSVIVLHTYVRKFPFKLSCNRKNVFWRDNYHCQYCGGEFKINDLTMDHVNPKSKGGEKSWENIVTSCKCCNSKKRDRTPKEAKMPLIKKPYSPRVGLLDLNRNIPIHKDWKIFFKELK
jgi:5-methylcytosine-specific restriction endonuclease McrA|tara:strand:- start:2214 stop:2720 length:507 start_codon:yes stop_codon:yes gene_type:complete